MKGFVIALFSLVILSGLAGLVTWRIVGAPDRSIPCDPENLPADHVCLSTIREWPEEGILWVDARPRAEWEKNGVQGSVLVNDVEEWFELEPEFMMQMMGHPRPKVVVYCNQEGCGSSKYVANQLRERHAMALGFEVHVLQGGIKALLAEKIN